ncbi:MAG: hypothetical protein ACRD0K_05530 [Egibacteraceae bacterium]
MAVLSVLRNPVYIGEIRHGEALITNVGKNSSSTKTKWQRN